MFGRKCLIVGLVLASVTPSLAADELQTLKSTYRRPTEIPFPASNPYTPEKAALGKALYFDPRMSGAENMTCASCHNPSFGWEAPNKTSVGAQNTRLDRQAPTILNLAWAHPFFWDGRADSAEEQAKGPIEAPVEMNLPLTEAVKRLNRIPDYKAWFGKALQGLVTKVGDINSVVLEIASGAERQAADLREVNAAVCEMDKVTQQNAAMAEQATAVSHSLAEESDRLMELVGLFNVGGGEVKSHRRGAERHVQDERWAA